MTLRLAPRPDSVRRLGCFPLPATGGANRRGLGSEGLRSALRRLLLQSLAHLTHSIYACTVQSTAKGKTQMSTFYIAGRLTASGYGNIVRP